MNIDQLRNWFPDESACRQFFENARWPKGRICPHCGHHVSYVIHASHRNCPCYQCKSCKRQFTVTTKTVLHSTKLKLWKWVQAIHLIMNSSKGISSVVLARMIGTTQPTAWKVGHAIRRLMDSNQFDATLLTGIVELDEMYVGGNPVPQPGVVHKRGKGTSKQWVLIAAQRCGPVRAVPIDDEKASTVRPIVDQYIDKNCHLMSDGHRTYINIGKHFSAHSYVTRTSGEYARGQTHSNTAESFVSFFERTRVGVFHFISDKHLSRYLHEATFRWDNRVPKEKKTPSGKKKVIMRPRPFKETLLILASRIAGIQLRRTNNWSIKDLAVV